MKRGWWHYIPHFLLGLGAVWLLWRLRLVLAPFAIAYLLAALLDPVVDAMERAGCRRGWAVWIIFGAFLLLFALGMWKVLPVVVSQVVQLARDVPGYVEKAPVWLDQLQERLGSPEIPQYLRDAVMQHVGQITSRVAAQVAQWTQGAIQSAGFLVWLIIIPLATFYLLNDIDRIHARALELVPEKHRGTVQDVAHDVGVVFVSYVRGVCLVSLLYGTAVLVALLVLRIFGLRVPYVVHLGIMAGVLYPIQVLGPIVTTLTIFLVAVLTGGWLAGVAAGVTPVLANLVFDQLVYPRVVGKSVGLHPLAAMLSLLVGAQLFGLVGMVVAYPVAGALQVVVRRLWPRLRPHAPLDALPAPAEGPAQKPAPRRRPRSPRAEPGAH